MLPPSTCLSHAWIYDIQWTLTGHYQDQWWTCVHFPNPSPPRLAFFPSHWPERSSCPQTRCSGHLHPTTMPSGLPWPHLIKRENSLDIIYGPLSHFIFLQCSVLTWGSLELTPLLPWWSVQNRTPWHTDLDLFATSLPLPWRTDACFLCAQVRTFTMPPANINYKCVLTGLLASLHPSLDKAP